MHCCCIYSFIIKSRVHICSSFSLPVCLSVPFWRWSPRLLCFKIPTANHRLAPVTTPFHTHTHTTRLFEVRTTPSIFRNKYLDNMDAQIESRVLMESHVYSLTSKERIFRIGFGVNSVSWMDRWPT